ncbi:hypothetical protein JYU19_02420 [bacterium AH-315-J21]|nr:hypothetical protein [bacterium AH-315-J21]
MKSVFLAVSAILMVAGLVLINLARRHRMPGAPPMPSYNPVHWFQPWNISNWLTPTGLKLASAANVCIVLGISIGAITSGIPSIFD